MQSRHLGKNGPTVSVIGLGCMGMSDFYGPADRDESLATIAEATERGVDLAKNVFQLHAASMTGQPQFCRKLSRQSFPGFMAKQPPAVVVMEACRMPITGPVRWSSLAMR